MSGDLREDQGVGRGAGRGGEAGDRRKSGRKRGRERAGDDPGTRDGRRQARGELGAATGEVGEDRGLLLNDPLEGQQRAGLEGQRGDLHLVAPAGVGWLRLGGRRLAALEQRERPSGRPVGRASGVTPRGCAASDGADEPSIRAGTQVGNEIAAGAKTDEGGILNERGEGHAEAPEPRFGQRQNPDDHPWRLVTLETCGTRTQAVGRVS
jgi:hypothetical protein